MGFAVRSQYTQYILLIIPSRWNYRENIFNRLLDENATTDQLVTRLFSQDTDITSRSVSNRSTSTTKLEFWTLLKVPVRWFFVRHLKVWWLSLICHVCFVWQWFAVRLCIIQPCAHTHWQQNHYYCYCRYIMTSNSFHNIFPAWDGVYSKWTDCKLK